MTDVQNPSAITGTQVRVPDGAYARADLYRTLIQFSAPTITFQTNEAVFEMFQLHFAGRGFLGSSVIDKTNHRLALDHVLPSIPADDRDEVKRRYIGPLKHTPTGVVGIITRANDAYDHRFNVRLFHEDPFTVRNITTDFVESLNDVNKQAEIIQFPNESDRKVALKVPQSKSEKSEGRITHNLNRRREVVRLLRWQLLGAVLGLILTIGLHWLAYRGVQPNHWIDHASQHFGRLSTALAVGAAVLWASLAINNELQKRLTVKWNN